VAQALTVYGKIVGKKRTEAAALDSRIYRPMVTGIAVPAIHGNGGYAKGNANKRPAPAMPVGKTAANGNGKHVPSGV
jgi:hypothetical protein